MSAGDKRLGRLAYEAARTERLSRRPSDEVIEWSALNDETQGMWLAAADAVADDKPARPVEDREPVGPYAPTRTSGEVIVHSTEWLQERFDAVLAAIHDVNAAVAPDETEVGQSLPRITAMERAAEQRGYQRGITAAECTIDHQAVADQAFERGRQQGDADRAERGLTEFERGKTVGAIQRESELLNAGWTPPGASADLKSPSVRDTLIDAGWIPPGSLLGQDYEVNDGPTHYEVWRDALTLASTCGAPTDDPGDLIDKRGPGSRYHQILADAAWFRDKLINYPTISPAEADQAADDQIAKIGDVGDGTTFGTGPTE